MTSGRVILAGGSGFLGRSLARALVERGFEPVVLSRAPRAANELAWDGRSAGDWAGALDGAAAVVNLAGRSIDCRFTDENRREILESRVDAVRAVGEAVRRAKMPPP